jgi:hypothetical protein
MATYEPIQTNTLTSNSSSITFNGIPQSYTDLILVTYALNTGGNTDLFLRFNNDTGANYVYQWLSNSATGTVNNTANVRMGYYALPQSTFEFTSQTDIIDYTSTQKYKSFITRADAANVGGGDAIVGTYRSLSPITRIDIVVNGGSFGVGSRFTVFGVKSA